MGESNYILRKYQSYSVHDLENIIQRKICLTAPKNFNDPVDTYFQLSDSEKFQEAKKMLTQEIMSTIRIACFSNHEKIREDKKDKKLTPSEYLMWTHYANSHKGISLEYHVPRDIYEYIEPSNAFDKTKSILSEATYIPDLAIDFENFFAEQSVICYEELLQNTFFTKDACFAYEYEKRMLIYEETGIDYISRDFDFLKKVIFGRRCTESAKRVISMVNETFFGNTLELYEINSNFEEIKYEK